MSPQKSRTPATSPRRALEAALGRFFGQQPMQAMVVARVGLGLTIFFSYLTKLPYLQALYGPDGISGYSMHQKIPDALVGRPLESSLQLLVGVASAELIWLLYLLLLAASLCFAAGAFTRCAGLVTLVLHALFHARNMHATLGWAVMIKPYLFFVLMAPVGRFGSFDAWRKRRSTPLVPIEDWAGPGWTVRLLQMQLCTMYAVAGWSRFDDPAWLSGDMLFVALDGRTYGRFDVDWFPAAAALRTLSWGAFVLEPLAPFLLWVRGVGKWWALALIAMHVNLEIFASVGWWQFMMVPLLLVFLPAEWTTAVIQAPARLFRRVG